MKEVQLLQDLGLTKETIEEKIIEAAVDRLVSPIDQDKLSKRVQNTILESVESEYASITDEFIVPLIKEKMESTTIQRTNSWGDHLGPAVSVKQYIHKLTTEYLEEEVNSAGKGRGRPATKSQNSRMSRLMQPLIREEVLSRLEEQLTEIRNKLLKSVGDTLNNSVIDMENRIKKALQGPTK